MKVHRGYRRHQEVGLPIPASVCCNPTRQCPIQQGHFNFCHLIRVTLIFNILRDVYLIFTPASYMPAGNKKKFKRNLPIYIIIVKVWHSGLVANEQRSQHKLVMALCHARPESSVIDSREMARAKHGNRSGDWLANWYKRVCTPAVEWKRSYKSQGEIEI